MVTAETTVMRVADKTWRKATHRLGPGPVGWVGRTAAFTLLEVMLAVTILSLVITVTYTLWSTALTAWRRGMAGLEDVQRDRIVVEALENLTRAAVFFPANPDFYTVRGTLTPGLGSTISFVTASPWGLPESQQMLRGLRRVTIGLRYDERGRLYLGFCNTPAVMLTEEPERDAVWQVLSREVIGFEVRYRDPRNNIWVTEWQETHLVPSALEYTVAFRSGAPGLPPLIVTRGFEWMSAEYVLERFGLRMNQQETTNTISRREINLAEDALRDEPYRAR